MIYEARTGKEDKDGFIDPRKQRKPRPVKYGTSNVDVKGGEAAPYDVFIGNTNPGSTEDIVKNVLKECSQNMPEDLRLSSPLEILNVECLTKPREVNIRRT